MAVLEMQRISICALKKERKKILEFLQQTGVVEIDANVQEDDVFQKMDTASARGVFEKNAQVAERALDICSREERNAGLAGRQSSGGYECLQQRDREAGRHYVKSAPAGSAGSADGRK